MEESFEEEEEEEEAGYSLFADPSLRLLMAKIKEAKDEASQFREVGKEQL